MLHAARGKGSFKELIVMNRDINLEYQLNYFIINLDLRTTSRNSSVVDAAVNDCVLPLSVIKIRTYLVPQKAL